MSSMPDLSALMQMMQDKNMDISSMMEMLGQSSFPREDASSSSTPPNAHDGMPDTETMLKMMRLMQAMNSQDASASMNLLYALKPFLRDSKKDKVEQCANFLKMSRILQEWNKSGGDKN